MKARLCLLLPGLLALFSGAGLRAETEAELIAAAHPGIRVERRHIEGDERKLTYFLSHKSHSGPFQGLLLLLPGGAGGGDFLPFCSRLAHSAFPENWLCVELVAPQWRPAAPDVVVWPSALVRDAEAKFDTEDFVKDLLAEVKDQELLKGAPVVALGWSSSGHAVISCVQTFPELRGGILAGSRFFPAWLKSRSGVRGKAFFLYHGVDDPICPVRDAVAAEKQISQWNGRAKLVTFPGGHGWPPGTNHMTNLKEGLAWILEKPDRE